MYLNFIKKNSFLVSSLLSLSLIGCGGGGGSSSTPAPVSDTSVPIFTSSNIASVNENQINAITLNATDNSTVTYSIGGTDAGYFNINSTNGVVTFKVAPDYEAKSSYSFIATATDSSNNVTTQNITINILDVQENGLLIDDIVVGAKYINGSNSGFTDINGRFPYTSGSIEFYVGGIKIGTLNSLPQDNQVFIQDLVGVDRSNINDSKVLKIAKLLQSIDSDSSNKIIITSENFKKFESNSDLIENLNVEAVLNSKSFAPKNEEEVKTHLENVAISNGFISIDSTIPIFTSSNIANVNENQINAITLNATDNSTVTYSIGGTDAGYFNINSTNGVVTFKVAPDYEAKSSYTFIATATDSSNNIATQNVTINILNLDEGENSIPENTTTSLYITSAVYSNSNTVSTNDDILYIYFNKAINESSININDISSNYIIEGVGAIGSASTSTYDSALFRQKIVLNSSSTATIELNTLSKIAIKPNGIKSSDNLYPESFPQKTIEKFNSVSRVQSGQTTTFSSNDDGALKRGISRNFSRDNTNNIVKDLSTGLMWQDDSDVLVAKTWVQAKNYCEALTLGGYTNWYLPNMKELSSISDKEKYQPSIFSIFQNLSSRTIENNVIYTDSFYWTTTVGVAYSGLPWIVEFYSGGTDAVGADNSFYARCVHKLEE